MSLLARSSRSSDFYPFNCFVSFACVLMRWCVCSFCLTASTPSLRRIGMTSRPRRCSVCATLGRLSCPGHRVPGYVFLSFSLFFFRTSCVCVCDLLSSTSIHFPACLRVYDLSCYCFIICCCIEKNCLAYIFAVEFLVR